MTDHTDTRSLYILIVSLLGTLIALPAVWYFTEAAYAAPGLVASRHFQLSNDGSCSGQHR